MINYKQADLAEDYNMQNLGKLIEKFGRKRQPDLNQYIVSLLSGIPLTH